MEDYMKLLQYIVLIVSLGTLMATERCENNFDFENRLFTNLTAEKIAQLDQLNFTSTDINNQFFNNPKLDQPDVLNLIGNNDNRNETIPTPKETLTRTPFINTSESDDSENESDSDESDDESDSDESDIIGTDSENEEENTPTPFVTWSNQTSPARAGESLSLSSANRSRIIQRKQLTPSIQERLSIIAAQNSKRNSKLTHKNPSSASSQPGDNPSIVTARSSAKKTIPSVNKPLAPGKTNNPATCKTTKTPTQNPSISNTQAQDTDDVFYGFEDSECQTTTPSQEYPPQASEESDDSESTSNSSSEIEEEEITPQAPATRKKQSKSSATPTTSDAAPQPDTTIPIIQENEHQFTCSCPEQTTRKKVGELLNQHYIPVHINKNVLSKSLKPIKSNNRFYCPTANCDSSDSFHTAKACNRHINAKHGGEAEKGTTIINTNIESFYKKEAKKHITPLEKQNGKSRNQCKICNHICTARGDSNSLTAVISHIITNHCKPAIFTCSKCIFASNNQQTVDSHTKNTDHRTTGIIILSEAEHHKFKPADAHKYSTLLDFWTNKHAGGEYAITPPNILHPTPATIPAVQKISLPALPNNSPAVTFPQTAYNQFLQDFERIFPTKPTATKNGYKYTHPDLAKPIVSTSSSHLKQHAREALQRIRKLFYVCGCPTGATAITLSELFTRHYLPQHLDNKKVSNNIDIHIITHHKHIEEDRLTAENQCEIVPENRNYKATCLHPECPYTRTMSSKKASKENMEKHYFTHHMPARHFECGVQECNYLSNDEEDMKKHITQNPSMHQIKIIPTDVEMTPLQLPTSSDNQPCAIPSTSSARVPSQPTRRTRVQPKAVLESSSSESEEEESYVSESSSDNEEESSITDQSSSSSQDESEETPEEPAASENPPGLSTSIVQPTSATAPTTRHRTPAPRRGVVESSSSEVTTETRLVPSSDEVIHFMHTGSSQAPSCNLDILADVACASISQGNETHAVNSHEEFLTDHRVVSAPKRTRIAQSSTVTIAILAKKYSHKRKAAEEPDTEEEEYDNDSDDSYKPEESDNNKGKTTSSKKKKSNSRHSSRVKDNEKEHDNEASELQSTRYFLHNAGFIIVKPKQKHRCSDPSCEKTTERRYKEYLLAKQLAAERRQQLNLPSQNSHRLQLRSPFDEASSA